MRNFEIGGATIGNISAIYYYTYAGVQVPAGLLLDRFQPKLILGGAATICAIGSYVFAYAGSIFELYIGRLLIGLGAGFAFVGALKIAAIWFPPRQFSYVTGLTFSLGLVGGLLGQAPLAILTSQFGWRFTMGISTIIILALAFLIIGFIPAKNMDMGKNPKGFTVWKNLRLILQTPPIWVLAVSGGGMAAIITSFTGLWAVPFFIQVKEVSSSAAAGLASIVFVGTIIGAPLAGFFSDRIKKKKPVILFAAWLVLIDLVLIIYVNFFVQLGFYILLLILGLGLGCVIIIYAIARTYSPPGAEGTTMAFVNMLVISLGAIFQPIVGWLLDLNWNGDMLDGVRIYSLEAYFVAFSSLVLVSFATLLCALIIREPKSIYNFVKPSN